MISIYGIARRNLRRRVFRSAAILLSVGLVTAVLFSVIYVTSSVQRGLKRSEARLGADIIVVPADAEPRARTVLLSGEPTTFYMDRKIEDMVRAVEGVKGVASEVYLQTAEYAQCCDVSSILLIGFDPEKDFTLVPWLSDRHMSPPSSREVIIGMDVALRAYSPGSTIKLYGTEFRVKGMLEETGLKFIDNSVFIPFAGVREMIKGSNTKKNVKRLSVGNNRISSVLVQVKPGYDPSSVAAYITEYLPGVRAVVPGRLLSSIRERLSGVIRSVFVLTGAVWIVALVLIGVIFSMIVNERQRELCLLRAMGAKRGDIFRLIMAEALMLSLIGSLSGILCGGVFLYFFTETIKATLSSPFLLPSMMESLLLTAACILVSLLTGTVAAMFPAFRSMLADPYEAIVRRV
ncbi:macrolide export ATP-binding/permease protein MacB [bacterium BMS3Bbin06]|nr:macrolide export ATP-binding/permease protein MacB [bacterium BMS3Abin08]GBE33788.1 macrolide export ATP-binding/permease protein MacB [bacterium BMS3Bbin06]HDY70210.1 ABC transporter permease [Nitrospirota bacterium]